MAPKQLSCLFLLLVVSGQGAHFAAADDVQELASDAKFTRQANDYMSQVRTTARALSSSIATVACEGLASSECGANFADALEGTAEVLELEDGVFTHTSTFAILRSVVVRAKNQGKAVLNGENARGVLTIGELTIEKVVVDGLEITNGSVTWGQGGGITMYFGYYATSTVNISNTNICENKAPSEGAGVRIYGSDDSYVSFNNCGIYSNEVETGGYYGGGGVLVEGGNVAFISCEVHHNYAIHGGGVFIVMSANVHFESCDVHHNIAYGGGGAISTKSISGGSNNDGPTIIVSSTDFRYNIGYGLYTDSSTGSAIYLPAGSVYLANATFVASAADETPMITALQPMTWTCQLGGWAPATGTLPSMNFTGCPYSCPAGTIGLSTSLTSAGDCTPCPMGHQCPSTGMAVGEGCPIGTHSPGVGAQSCLLCGPGTANDLVEQSQCAPCLAGFATADTGSTSCTACAVASYASANGTVACTACPAFSTTSAVGSTNADACTCVQGYFLDTDATGKPVCQQCRNVFDFSTTPSAGATSVDQCVCDPGYYLKVTSGNSTHGKVRECVLCDEHLMDCSIPGITVANMPIAAGGWRVSNTSTEVLECFNKAACVGAAGPAAVAASRRRLISGTNASLAVSSTAGDALCAAGHTGILCGACLDGFYGYKDDALCIECEGNIALGFAPLIIVIFLIVLAVLVRVVVKKRGGSLEMTGPRRVIMAAIDVLERARPKAKILVSLYQIVGGLGATFAIPFPNIYEQIVSVVSGILTIELPALMPIDCLAPTNFHSLLVFKTTWPLIAYAFLYLLAKLLRKAHKDKYADGCIDFLFLIMFIMYPSITNGLFSSFYCFGLEDGTSWLRVDLSIQCTDTSSATTVIHATMQAYAVVMIVVHVIGTPATYMYLLFWKHKGALEALAEQERLDEYKAGVEQTAQYTAQYKMVVETDKPRLDKSAVLPGYIQKLCGGYRLRVYWYELFETIRKVLIVGIPATFPERGGTAQLFWGLIVTVGSGTVLALYSPYANLSDNLLAQFAQFQVFLTLLSSLALRASPPSKVVGDMVTVVLIAVPLIAIYFETMLFDWSLKAYAVFRARFVEAFNACRPPAFCNEPLESSTVKPSSNKDAKGSSSSTVDMTGRQLFERSGAMLIHSDAGALEEGGGDVMSAPHHAVQPGEPAGSSGGRCGGSGEGVSGEGGDASVLVA